LQFVFDLLALAAAWRLTVELRVALNPWMAKQLTGEALALVAPPLGGILLLWVGAAVWRGAYRQPSDESAAANLLQVADNAFLAGVLTIVATFFSRGFGANLSRSFVLLFAPVSLLMMTGARYLVLLTATFVERRWPSPERVAVIGAGAEARRVVDRIRSAGDLLVKVTGVILPDGASSEGLGNPVPVLGRTAQLAEVINRSQLDRLVVVNGCLTDQEVDECGQISTRMGVILNRAIAMPEGHARQRFTRLYGMHLLELRPITFTRTQGLLKRAFDVVAAGLLLLALGPVLLLCALLIRIASKGPALFRSLRVGKGGRHFTFLKFRSMYTGQEGRQGLAESNEKCGHIFKIRNDPRVTPVGRLLRRYSLDELPQLLNVLRGEMSLVGPRPLPAEDLEMDGTSREHQYWADQRARALPGITGLWQIRGRSDLEFEQMVELDVTYIQNWSLALDLRILLETPLVVLGGRGAY